MRWAPKKISAECRFSVAS